ncbi:hypothetical protein U728_3783 (plasmid) [Clostridium botulinum 202F]|uniref:hypothetical protein n=1 Tax=Clostridium TaxID=1485 RepID=UPI0005408A18|nr:hypothetical protein [Clostridium botulinum]AIY82238.1 hypothetical protein U728_3783 [Clostridium botulinum 202F]KAI3344472.1 hypothetical protein CIT17_17005 [Clostridium botulinum]KON13523.1 hypothetical protein ACP50_05490 [Clostridium botulinum]MBY6987900.1 hypothetical protein [Clostridium botulinum]NFH01498.1 hypothetical protein [Clostridium botulinum]
MEIVMNHEQYLNWKNNNKSTLDIKLENLGLKDGKRFKKELIIGIGTTLFLINNPTHVLAVDLESVDKLGNTFLNILQRVGYWIALLSALAEIVKTSMRGGNNTAEIGKIIMKYLLIYASLYLMPYMFGLVREAF